MSGVAYIDSPPLLAPAIERLARQPLVAMDTEAASFHKYVDRVYLVQLSSRTETVVLDPLALDDLSSVGRLLADPAVEKVFHDADYDLRILDRDYGFRAARLFDTRIAAQLLGETAFGLAALLEKYGAVRLSKAHQRADWSQRPLSEAMLAYAADDTRHLPALRDTLREQLRQRGRLAWAEEEFQRLESVRWTGREPDDTEAYVRLKGAKQLRPRHLAALRELFQWREDEAKRLDRAVFRVMSNEALLAIAKALPRTVSDLARITDLPASLARRHEADLLAAVVRALEVPEGELPTIPRAPRGARPDATFDVRLERLKDARNRVAKELGLDPGVVSGKGTLAMVARLRPKDRAGLATVDGLRRWQIEVLGDAMLAAMSAAD
jgi:ribonuclease D